MKSERRRSSVRFGPEVLQLVENINNENLPDGVPRMLRHLPSNFSLMSNWSNINSKRKYVWIILSIIVLLIIIFIVILLFENKLKLWRKITSCQRGWNSDLTSFDVVESNTFVDTLFFFIRMKFISRIG